jgi:hypothetical protein
LSSMDSAVKGDDMPVVKLTHHVEFGTPKAVDPDALAQLSAAHDWFTSLGAGEPPYTACTPKLHGCVDYIWFTPVSRLPVWVGLCWRFDCDGVCLCRDP